MINTGDKLLCTSGNYFYQEGQLYTVGEFVNGRYFKLATGFEDEHWYATIDDSGIYVSFDCATRECEDARFEAVKGNNEDWLAAYNVLSNV